MITKLNMYPYQIMERTNLLMTNVEDSLMEHPYFIDNPEMLYIVEQAHQALHKLYQIACSDWYKETQGIDQQSEFHDKERYM